MKNIIKDKELFQKGEQQTQQNEERLSELVDQQK